MIFAPGEEQFCEALLLLLTESCFFQALPVLGRGVKKIDSNTEFYYKTSGERR